MSGWTVVRHLEASEIESRYKFCADGREETHWQIILLAMQGISSKDIAQIVRYNQWWVEKLIPGSQNLKKVFKLDARCSNGIG